MPTKPRNDHFKTAVFMGVAFGLLHFSFAYDRKSEKTAVPSELMTVWIKKGETLGPDAVAKMLRLFSEDPESNLKLQQAAQKLGKDKLEDVFYSLVDMVDTISEDTAAETHRGQLKIFSRIFIDGDGTEEKQIVDMLEAEKGKYVSYRVERDPLYIQLKTVTAPRIELPKGKPLISAFATLVHELVHALAEMEVHEELDGTQFGGMSELINAILTRRGGEFEAYREGVGVFLRLKKKFKLEASPMRDEFFDDNGVLTKPDGLKSDILGDDMFGGYISEFRAAGRKMIIVQYYNLKFDLDLFYGRKHGNDVQTDYGHKLDTKIELLKKKMSWLEEHYAELIQKK